MTSQMPQKILTEVDHGVGIVTLNNPAQNNVLDRAALGELAIACASMDADPNVHVLVLSSVGSSYCSGIQDNDASTVSSAGIMLQALADMNKPIVARVQGAAHGVALALIAACDVALATFDASFSLAGAAHGQLPSVITPYLSAAIGLRHTRRYLLTAETFSAAEAYRIGLVHEMVADKSVLDVAIGEVVAALLENCAAVHTAGKTALRAASRTPSYE